MSDDKRKVRLECDTLDIVGGGYTHSFSVIDATTEKVLHQTIYDEDGEYVSLQGEALNWGWLNGCEFVDTWWRN